jgi:hypothetical protein
MRLFGIFSIAACASDDSYESVAEDISAAESEAKECSIQSTPFSDSGNVNGPRFGVEYSPTFFGDTKETRIQFYRAAHATTLAGPRLRFDNYFDGSQRLNNCYVPNKNRWEDPAQFEQCDLGHPASSGSYFDEGRTLAEIPRVVDWMSPNMDHIQIRGVELWLTYMHEGAYLNYQLAKAEIEKLTGLPGISTAHWLGLDNFVAPNIRCAADDLSFGNYCPLDSVKPFLKRDRLPSALRDNLDAKGAFVQAFTNKKLHTIYNLNEVQAFYMFSAVYGAHINEFLHRLGERRAAYERLPYDAKFYYHSLAFNRGSEVALSEFTSMSHTVLWANKDNPGCSASLKGRTYNSKVRLAGMRYLKMLCLEPTTRTTVASGLCSDLSDVQVIMPNR